MEALMTMERSRQIRHLLRRRISNISTSEIDTELINAHVIQLADLGQVSQHRVLIVFEVTHWIIWILILEHHLFEIAQWFQVRYLLQITDVIIIEIDELQSGRILGILNCLGEVLQGGYPIVAEHQFLQRQHHILQALYFIDFVATEIQIPDTPQHWKLGYVVNIVWGEVYVL